MSVKSFVDTTDPDAIRSYRISGFLYLDPSKQWNITKYCPITRYELCEDAKCVKSFSSKSIWKDAEYIYVRQNEIFHIKKVYLVGYTMFNESTAVLIDFTVEKDINLEVVNPRSLKFLRSKDSHEKSSFHCVVN